MKHSKIFFGFLVLLCSAALFLGCPTDPAEEEPNYGGDVKTLAVQVAASDGTVYYSLSTGQPVTGDAINTTAWDIAFKRSRLVFVNSGATPDYKDATNNTPYVTSTGNGGVWHVTKTDLADVLRDDAVENDSLYGPYNKDVVRYISGRGGAAPTRINIMTFTGYSNEADNNGLSEDSPFVAPYSYDKKQFYGGGTGMPPVFFPTNQIYIIKHGDGVKYSKIQITAYQSNTDTDTDTYQIVYRNF
jgi:hypothetical protein